MSDVFFTSDLHIGHKKIAGLRCGHEGELPEWFGDYEVNRHDEILARKWDSTVGRDDHVWVLGDISSGTKDGQTKALNWIMERPGIKHLIAGNHDSVHPLHRDSYKWLPVYLDGAFATVQMAAKRRIPLREGHRTALMSHFPYTGDHTALQRYPQWRLPDNGDWLLHGHVHSTEKVTAGGNQRRLEWDGMGGLVQLPPRLNQIHVGVDAWDGKPVSFEEIRDVVRKAEAGR